MQEVKIKIENIELNGLLVVPKDAKAIILFVHGSGSSRFSSRNQFVSKILNKNGFATLLIASSQNKVPFAIVSRGGRPDLALNFLKNVVSPTLLIIGGNDFEVIEMNKKAFAKLKTKKKLEIVSGASHLFEEEGALEKVSSLAINWFKGNLK